MTMAELSDSLDESLQKIDYHIRKLFSADLVEVVVQMTLRVESRPPIVLVGSVLGNTPFHH